MDPAMQSRRHGTSSIAGKIFQMPRSNKRQDQGSGETWQALISKLVSPAIIVTELLGLSLKLQKIGFN
jgi:hypothetical protein